MLIECVSDKPIRLVGPRLPSALILPPGEPMEVSNAIGHQLIGHPSRKIRVSRMQWTQSWQELSSMTEGLVEDDPLFHRILKELDFCDQAFEREQWMEFFSGYQTIKTLVASGLRR